MWRHIILEQNMTNNKPLKKDFDLLLEVCVEEYSDTLQASSAEVRKFLLKLYKDALEAK